MQWVVDMCRSADGRAGPHSRWPAWTLHLRPVVLTERASAALACASVSVCVSVSGRTTGGAPRSFTTRILSWRGRGTWPCAPCA